MPNSVTIAQARHAAAGELAAAGIDNAQLDARVLLQEVLGLTPAALITAAEQPLTADQHAAFTAAVARRAAREPIAYITGHREFWSLDFQVRPGVLIPRPDSETVVESALALLPADKPAHVLDLGTGSGCLLLAVLSERPAASGLGIDASPVAAATARANASALGLADRAEFIVGDWATAVAATFDLVLCNPPYIPAGDIPELMPEVARHEPAGALDGGAQGLDAYTGLLPDLPRLLAPGGHAVVEFGAGQADSVAALAAAAGLASAPPAKDLAGHDRCMVLAAQP